MSSHVALSPWHEPAEKVTNQHAYPTKPRIFSSQYGKQIGQSQDKR